MKDLATSQPHTQCDRECASELTDNWFGASSSLSSLSPFSGTNEPEAIKENLSFLLFFYSAAAAASKSLQSCPTLCDPIDGLPPGSAIPGILQARTLEWVAISSLLRFVKSFSGFLV